MSGNNILTKNMNSIYELDYATLYSAVIKKTDPYTVDSIEYIKELMKNK